MDEENKSQKQLLEEAAERESGLQREIKSLLRKIDDIESKVSMCVLVLNILLIARSYGDCKKLLSQSRDYRERLNNC